MALSQSTFGVFMGIFCVTLTFSLKLFKFKSLSLFLVAKNSFISLACTTLVFSFNSFFFVTIGLVSLSGLVSMFGLSPSLFIGGHTMGWFVVLGFGVRLFPKGFVVVPCIVVSLGFVFILSKFVKICCLVPVGFGLLLVWCFLVSSAFLAGGVLVWFQCFGFCLVSVAGL